MLPLNLSTGTEKRKCNQDIHKSSFPMNENVLFYSINQCDFNFICHFLPSKSSFFFLNQWWLWHSVESVHQLTGWSLCIARPEGKRIWKNIIVERSHSSEVFSKAHESYWYMFSKAAQSLFTSSVFMFTTNTQTILKRLSRSPSNRRFISAGTLWFESITFRRTVRHSSPGHTLYLSLTHLIPMYLQHERGLTSSAQWMVQGKHARRSSCIPILFFSLFFFFFYTMNLAIL